MYFWRLMVLLSVVAIAGCGGEGESVTAPDISPQEAVKAALEDIAQTGRGGSEIGAIMNDLEKMKQTDQQTAEALIKDANELMSMSGEAKIKAKAKEMLGKLSSAAGGGGRTE